MPLLHHLPTRAVLVGIALLILAGCGANRVAAVPGALPTSPPPPAATPTPRPSPTAHRTPTPTAPAPLVQAAAPAAPSAVPSWVVAVLVHGRDAAWVARVAPTAEPGATVTLVRFDQSLLTLALHAGYTDPGGSGWTYGDQVGAKELPQLVAAFNGGFRFSTGDGGFRADGRTPAPLQTGVASVVTYADGTSDVGTWGAGVPGPGHGAVVSVRQNLRLLIAGGAPTNVDACIEICWGATLHGAYAVARSGLGVTADGQLVWAGGEGLTVRALAEALV
ncbi:MAG: hypothetical protein ACYDB7_12690, partial [Mycobacteriales bacterium]